MANMSPLISFTISTVGFILTFSLKFGSHDASAPKVLLQCEEAWLDLLLITGQASTEPGNIGGSAGTLCTSQRISWGRAELRPLQAEAKQGKALLFMDLFFFLMSEGKIWRFRDVFMLFSYVLHRLCSVINAWSSLGLLEKSSRPDLSTWPGKFHTLHIFLRYSDKIGYSIQF